MRITKFGHSCFLVEEGEARILLDPGVYSEGFDTAGPIDAILITHEHQDHYAPQNLKALLAANPHAEISTNSGVAEKMKADGIACNVVSEGQEFLVRGVPVRVYGREHAVIYPTFAPIVNTGYFIAGRFFHPGDAFLKPDRPVEILGVPLAGPWMRVAEGVDYAKELKPKVAIPEHDGILKNIGLAHFVPGEVLPSLGITFVVPKLGEPMEF